MLFTEQDLNILNPFNILDNATYLTEEESMTAIPTVPVVQNDYYNVNMVDFKDLERISEEYDCDIIDAMEAIIEQEQLNPEMTTIVVDEADFILNADILGEDVIIRPLSEYDYEYQYVTECVNAWLESDDEIYLSLLELAPVVMRKTNLVDFSASSDQEIENWINKVVGSQLAGETIYGMSKEQRANKANQLGLSSLGAGDTKTTLKQTPSTSQMFGYAGLGDSEKAHDLASYVHQAQQELAARKKYGSPKNTDTRDYHGTQVARLMKDGKSQKEADALVRARIAGQVASRAGQTHSWRQTTSGGIDDNSRNIDFTDPYEGSELLRNGTFAPLKNTSHPGSDETNAAYPTGHDDGRDAALLGIINTTSKAYHDANVRADKTKSQYEKLVGKHKNLKGKWYVRAGEKIDRGINWMKNNKGKTALGVGLGAAAIGGGIYAYKQYKNKPRSVIAKRIAALRSIYAKWMKQVQRNPQKANIIKRVAAKILSVIDKLMGYLQRKTDRR